MIEAGRRVREAGLFLSVTRLLGIAGMERSLDHARATAAVLTRSCTVSRCSPSWSRRTRRFTAELRAGRFTPPDRAGLFAELRCLLASLGPIRTQFSANHASNALALEGRLPRDRERLRR